MCGTGWGQMWGAGVEGRCRCGGKVQSASVEGRCRVQVWVQVWSHLWIRVDSSCYILGDWGGLVG